MKTDAAIALEAARAAIQDAIDNLSAVTMTRTARGWDDYDGTQLTDLRIALVHLADARRKLEW